MEALKGSFPLILMGHNTIRLKYYSTVVLLCIWYRTAISQIKVLGIRCWLLLRKTSHCYERYMSSKQLNTATTSRTESDLSQRENQGGIRPQQAGVRFTLVLHSRGIKFETRLGYQLQWLRAIFSGFTFKIINRPYSVWACQIIRRNLNFVVGTPWLNS